MNEAVLGGITLEYEISGVGEPVVFIHGALIADAFRPLLVEPPLTGEYRMLNYCRRGYRGSSHPSAPLTIAEQAADCQALLRYLGVSQAHVVGHSYGGAIALQLTHDAGSLVRSLVLLEPALIIGPSTESYKLSLEQSLQRFRPGAEASSVDNFLRARFGADYREYLERVLPGAFDQSVADAATTFTQELPALLSWRFTEWDARRIAHPVLMVLGEKSEALWPRFGQIHRTLLEWLPNVDELIVPDATHALQIQNPSAVARGLAAFLGRFPCGG